MTRYQEIEQTNARFSYNVSAGCRLAFLLRSSAAVGSHFRFSRLSAGLASGRSGLRGPARFPDFGFFENISYVDIFLSSMFQNSSEEIYVQQSFLFKTVVS